MTEQEDYTRRLEDALARLVERFDNIPFPVVVRAFSGFRVLPVDDSTEADGLLIDVVAKAAALAGDAAKKDGIHSNRPNEVGNRIEPYVRRALNEAGESSEIRADTPTTRTGGQQAVGYPDLEITEHSGRRTYLEVKTYNIQNVDTTMRAFYLSPPLRKVTRDARHMILAFQIVQEGAVFRPVHWRIYDAHDLVGQVKNEFNATNRQMYRSARLLQEGGVQ